MAGGKEILNPDFAREIAVRVSNTIQLSVSGYFLDEEIVNYFDVKKCSEMLSGEAVGSRYRFYAAKSGLNRPPNIKCCPL